MNDSITPVRRPRGRAATKSHHNRPSHDVAVRAFASKIGRGRTLTEYVAELVTNGEVLSQDDIEAKVDSGAFGRWLDARHNDKVMVDSVIVGSIANPNWTHTPAAPSKKEGEGFREDMKECAASAEQDALKFDREEAIMFCLENKISSQASFEAKLASITRDRHMLRDIKAWKNKKGGR